MFNPFTRVALAFAITSFLGAPFSTVSVASANYLDSRGNTRKEFQALWSERLESYRARKAPLATNHKAAADAFATSPFSFAAEDRRLDALMNSAVADGENDGRGMILTEFLSHISKKPSLGLTEAWLQSQFDTVREMDRQAEQSREQALGLLKNKDARVGDFLVAIELAALSRGRALGRAEELILLVSNFDAYSGEYARADTRDRETRQRLANALAGMAQGLRQNQGWSVQCSTMGAFTNCSGN